MTAPNFPKPWMHDLWAHLHNEHGLTLLESEIYEIVRLSDPGWQPIATAPMDGSSIVLWSPKYGIIHAFWQDRWEVSHNNSDGYGDPDLSDATHWRPLPTPPKS